MRTANLVELCESSYGQIVSDKELSEMTHKLVDQGFMDLAFEMLLSRM
jgi:hypothetical protein